MPVTIVVKLEDFTGLVQGGLLGNAPGQVFFSPALVTSAANSTIQVDEVNVCAFAYDTYNFPVILDPPILFTAPINPGPTHPTSLLGMTVLFARPERLGEATFSVAWENSDTANQATSSRAIATLEEPLDATRVSLLNNVYWKLRNGVDPPFITAANLTPIPPGPTTVITLEP